MQTFASRARLGSTPSGAIALIAAAMAALLACWLLWLITLSPSGAKKRAKTCGCGARIGTWKSPELQGPDPLYRAGYVHLTLEDDGLRVVAPQSAPRGASASATVTSSAAEGAPGAQPASSETVVPSASNRRIACLRSSHGSSSPLHAQEADQPLLAGWWRDLNSLVRGPAAVPGA